jgi:predicted porin
MKNELAVTALALSCASTWAQAPNTVEVYGTLDVGLNHVTGLAGGSRNQMVSGIMDGSRLGVRGNEDMGGGWRALFTLESRVEVNTGTIGNRPASGAQLPDRLSNATLLGLPTALQGAVNAVAASIGSTVGVNVRNAFWDRQVYVGLVTPVGALLAGHQYTPAYEMFATFDTLRTQSSLSAGQISATPTGVDIRADNALAYRIQQGPVSASAMMTFDGATPSSANRLMGVNGIYRGERFSIGGGYNTHKNELGETALRSGLVGATLDIGPGKLSGMVASIKDDHPAGLSTISATLQASGATAPQGALVQSAFVNGLKQDARLFNIGYTLVTGALTSYLSYSQFNDRRPADADVVSYGVAYSYALSKRTDINAVLTHFNNKGLAQAAPGGGGFLGGFTASAGTDSNNIALGVRHRF